ncbi:MAG: hypothetical protein ACPGUV_07860, partial [Polyangiales bacterium]
TPPQSGKARPRLPLDSGALRRAPLGVARVRGTGVVTTWRMECGGATSGAAHPFWQVDAEVPLYGCIEDDAFSLRAGRLCVTRARCSI